MSSVITAGYTRKEYGGHTSVPTDPPKDGYHGKEGYRRNTPDLRRRQSVFDYEGQFTAILRVVDIKATNIARPL